ncbi:MAG: transposase [Planctomycetota bacterium]
MSIDEKTVSRWRARFAKERLSGILKYRPRVSRLQHQRSVDTAQHIVAATTQEKPKDATQWSTRTLAQHLGVSDSTVQRVWSAAGLKPHLVKTFKVSNDPHFTETPQGKQLHLIVDNYATHMHEKVQRWLKRHKRFHIHFTPTSSSWLNLVERWFREITTKRIRRGAFRSVQEVIDAIMQFIETHNTNPKAYLWKAKADNIIEKVRRARAKLQKLQSE